MSDEAKSKMRKAADVAADVLRDPKARGEIDPLKAAVLREREEGGNE